MTSLLICLQDKNEYFLVNVSFTVNTLNFCTGVGRWACQRETFRRRLLSHLIRSREWFKRFKRHFVHKGFTIWNYWLTEYPENNTEPLKTWKTIEKQLKDISRYHSKTTAFPHFGHSGVQIPYSFESSLGTKAHKREVAVVLLPFLLSSLLLSSSREL